MKKFIFVFALTLVLLFTAYHFREPIIDFLPIDQSGWSTTDQGRCYLDEDGDPVSGWLELDGQKYYFDPTSHVMRTGWLEDGGSRYYFGPNGTMVSKAWVDFGGLRYYMGTTGAMHTGWLEDSGKHYYLSGDGTPLTGWQELEGKRFYFQQGGAAAVGWLETDEGRFYLKEDGSVHTGWLQMGEERYFLDELGAAVPGWADTDEGRYYLDEKGCPCTGLVETDEGWFSFDENGAPAPGWQDTDTGRRYFTEDGAMHTGWLEEDGKKYYLKEDGTPAVGKLVIDEQPFFFTSTGVNFIMVNPWHSLPEDFSVEVVQTTGGWVAPECKEALEKMLADCRAAGHHPQIVSSYRTIGDQRVNLQNMVNSYLDRGYSYNAAYAAATQIVAVPGTSEHHLGLALDIVDSSYPKLNHQQANMPTQKWLMENCWKYGFIMRYPEGSTEITGIIYEPWHYRYVGLELAKEIHDLGNIPLEIYIDNLTNDGTTCGGQTNE